MLNKEFLRECFEYSLSSGLVTWKVRPRNHFPTTSGWKIFNERYSGKIAGNINSANGYWQIAINNKDYRLHRLIWIYMTGEDSGTIDHINGDRADNRWINLRSVSREENQKNQKKRTDNASGQTGVSFSEEREKWCAYISSGRKRYSLGRFDSKQEAIIARKMAETKFGFHENHGRSQ